MSPYRQRALDLDHSGASAGPHWDIRSSRRSRGFTHSTRRQSPCSQSSTTASPLTFDSDDLLALPVEGEPHGSPRGKKVSRRDRAASTFPRSNSPVLWEEYDPLSVCLILSPDLVCAAVAFEVAIAGRVDVAGRMVDTEVFDYIIFSSLERRINTLTYYYTSSDFDITHGVVNPTIEGEIRVRV